MRSPDHANSFPPLSLGLLALAATLYLLMAVPLVNILSAFVIPVIVAPWALNGGILWLSVDAWYRRLPRWMVGIAPLWFTVGAGLAVSDLWAFHRVAERQEAINRAAPVIAGAAQSDIVQTNGLNDDSLLERGSADRIFSHAPHLPSRFVARHLTSREACAALQREFPENTAAGLTYHRRSGRYCVVTYPARPTRPVVSMANYDETNGNLTNKLSRGGLIFADRGGVRAHMVAAWRTRPSLILLPFLDCMSRMPRCTLTLIPKFGAPLSHRPDITQIERVLQRRPGAHGDMRRGGETMLARDRRILRDAMAAAHAENLAMLDRWIAAPDRVEGANLVLLRPDSDAVRDRVGGMIAALEWMHLTPAAMRRRGTASWEHVLYDLLRHQSPERLAPYRATLRAIATNRFETPAAALAIRAGASMTAMADGDAIAARINAADGVMRNRWLTHACRPSRDDGDGRDRPTGVHRDSPQPHAPSTDQPAILPTAPPVQLDEEDTSSLPATCRQHGR